MKKIYYTWRDIERQTQEILRQIQQDAWRPDYVVGLTRGGLVPANLISQYLGCRMETLKVSLRDGGECESNCWMAEDAYEQKHMQNKLISYLKIQGKTKKQNEILKSGAYHCKCCWV